MFRPVQGEISNGMRWPEIQRYNGAKQSVSYFNFCPDGVLASNNSSKIKLTKRLEINVSRETFYIYFKYFHLLR